MTSTKYWAAVNAAIAEEMERDESIFFVGQDIGAAGGPFGATRGLMDRFGPDRVRDTPISEQAMVALGTGAAMTGTRPIVEIMYMDFALLALDQLVNQAAKMRFMSGGHYRVPLTVVTMVAAHTESGPQHSQSFETWLGQVPGLNVVWPSNAADAKGLLKTAIRSDDPVVFIESLSAWRTTADVPEGEVVIPIGVARVARPGSDVTIVAVGGAVAIAERGADQLAERGLSAEVIDLRSVSPLDETTVISSVRKTGALLVVQEGPSPFGIGDRVVSVVCRNDPRLLRVRPIILAPPFSPTPFAPDLERSFYPGPHDVVKAVETMTGALQ
ncbi:MAG: transketolase C-terminal domain-containing protein [Actinomycetota bacterium]|nr:transketolase C-terminal domain-containing protein [Actinomycetota bacterium]